MVTLNMPEEEFKLLLTLCAHDFRHDFMNTSDRVHAGLIKGAKMVGGGGKGPKSKSKTKSKPKSKTKSKTKSNPKSKSKSKTKSNPKSKSKSRFVDDNVITNMATIFHDIIFFKNLKEQEVKSKVGDDKLKAMVNAMNNSNRDFDNFIKILKILIKTPIKKNNKMSIEPAVKTRTRQGIDVGAIKKSKQKKNKSKKKTKSKTSKIKRGGMMADYPGISHIDTNSRGDGFLRPPPNYFVDASDLGVIDDIGFEFYDLEDDYYNNISLNKYIETLSEGDRNSELQNEFIQDLNEVLTETVEDISEIKEQLTDEVVEEAPRRSGRTRANAFYGELLNESITDNWNTKYEIYSEMSPVDEYNRNIIDIEDLKIKNSNDFKDLKGFTIYYKTICKIMGTTRLNFNMFIQYLNSLHPEIQLAIAAKVSTDSIKTIKEFGNKISKVWYNFITGEAPRSISPTLSPPSSPIPLSEQGKEKIKLLAKMYHSTNSGTSTDATVFSLFKKYFNKHYSGKINSDNPTWKSSREIINNASQLNKYPTIFSHPEKCYAPSVLDAMSNCPNIGENTDDIDIKISSGDNFIHYKITGINSGYCYMDYDIHNNDKSIKNPDTGELFYKNKDLSVVSVLVRLFAKVYSIVDKIPCDSSDPKIEEKIEKFKNLAEDMPDFIYRNILPIFCMKLFGDLGQELLAVANGRVLASNDRPSAIRYMLMKLSAEGAPADGGGGYFPNNPNNSLYV